MKQILIYAAIAKREAIADTSALMIERASGAQRPQHVPRSSISRTSR